MNFLSWLLCDMHSGRDAWNIYDRTTPGGPWISVCANKDVSAYLELENILDTVEFLLESIIKPVNAMIPGTKKSCRVVVN